MISFTQETVPRDAKIVSVETHILGSLAAHQEGSGTSRYAGRTSRNREQARRVRQALTYSFGVSFNSRCDIRRCLLTGTTGKIHCRGTQLPGLSARRLAGSAAPNCPATLELAATPSNNTTGAPLPPELRCHSFFSSASRAQPLPKPVVHASSTRRCP